VPETSRSTAKSAGTPPPARYTERRRWPGPLRRDHPDIDVGRWLDAGEPDVEAVGEHQQLAIAEVRRDLGVVDGLLGRVGDQDHDHVRDPDGVRDVRDA
jgi:hypothetical protein